MSPLVRLYYWADSWLVPVAMAPAHVMLRMRGLRRLGLAYGLALSRRLLPKR